MAKTKKCFKCGKRKRINLFYRHPQMADGRLGKCKECTKSDVTKDRRAKPDQYRAYEAKRCKLPHRKALRDVMNKKFQANHPLAGRARCAVARALIAGTLVREPCSVCGSTFHVHAHHPNYAKPLVVVWLCAGCHRAHHQRCKK